LRLDHVHIGTRSVGPHRLQPAHYELIIAWHQNRHHPVLAGSGSVVTAAGLVFAFTMASFIFSDLRVLGQIGTTIALGPLASERRGRRRGTPPHVATSRLNVRRAHGHTRGTAGTACGDAGRPEGHLVLRCLRRRNGAYVLVPRDLTWFAIRGFAVVAAGWPVAFRFWLRGCAH
jgi:hypothetical protein